MRIFLFILGVFAAVVCFEKPTEAQGGPWCAYYDFGSAGATNCGFATFQQCLAEAFVLFCGLDERGR